jgi:hypothetical protein
MILFLQIVITAFEAVGEACGRRKPKTAEDVKRQRIQRRNERAMKFYALFCLIMLFIMALEHGLNRR